MFTLLQARQRCVTTTKKINLNKKPRHAHTKTSQSRCFNLHTCRRFSKTLMSVSFINTYSSIFMEAQKLERGGSHVGVSLTLKCAFPVLSQFPFPAHRGGRKSSTTEVHTNETTKQILVFRYENRIRWLPPQLILLLSERQHDMQRHVFATNHAQQTAAELRSSIRLATTYICHIHTHSQCVVSKQEQRDGDRWEGRMEKSTKKRNEIRGKMSCRLKWRIKGWWDN